MESLAATISKYWNPTGKALAAGYWKSKSGRSGFSPICRLKFNREAGCQMGGDVRRPCSNCSVKENLLLDNKMIASHLRGSKRIGIYAMLPGDMVIWTAADFDNHDGQKDPSRDIKKLTQVAKVFGIPLYTFSSNSGKGFHVYIFFSKAISAVKARRLMLGLIELVQVDLDHRKDRTGTLTVFSPSRIH